MIRPGLVALLALGGLALSPAVSSADTFFASPTGPNADPCSQAMPCSLEYAVETRAATNVGPDEVVVAPGNYPVFEFSDLAITTGVDLHGASPQQPPVITFDAPSGNGVHYGGSGFGQIRDLEIVNLGGGAGLNMANAGTTGSLGERLQVSSEGRACAPPIEGALRDSVCWSISSGNAIDVNLGAPAALGWRLVNVTAIAEGPGSAGIFLGTNNGANLLINASNVIADGVGADVRTQTNNVADTATVSLDHSNYASEDEGAGPGTENITNPGIGTNQTAAPTFAPGVGNFHQAAGSPTIDKGAGSPLSGGTLDFDGEARTQGESQDIGADEFTVLPPTGQPPQPPLAGVADLIRAKAKGKKLIATVACVAAGGCPGNRISLRTAKKLDLSRIAVAARRERILLGKGSFSLVAGETRTVRLKLRKQGRRLFKARKKVMAKATIASPAGTEVDKLGIKRK